MREAPEQLRLAASATFALRAEASQGSLTGRVVWLSQRLVCDSRTARRRADEALLYLVNAAQMLQPEVIPTGGNAWEVVAFRAFFRLDTPTPESTEHRRIVALREGLKQITNPYSVYRAEGDLSDGHGVIVEELYGARLTRLEHPIPEHFLICLELPEPLHRGQEHEFGLRLTLPEGQPLQPQYIYTPIVDCARFELTVRFVAQAPPAMVWQLEEALPLVVAADSPVGPLLAPDDFGELHVQFRDLKAGFGYGLKWTY